MENGGAFSPPHGKGEPMNRTLMMLGLLLLLGCQAGQLRRTNEVVQAGAPIVGAVDSDVAPIADAIADGMQGAADAVAHRPDDAPLDGHDWLRVLLGSLAAVATSWFATNYTRDRKRLKRGELV